MLALLIWREKHEPNFVAIGYAYSANASGGENLEVEQPGAGRYAAALYFYPRTDRHADRTADTVSGCPGEPGR